MASNLFLPISTNAVRSAASSRLMLSSFMEDLTRKIRKRMFAGKHTSDTMIILDFRIPTDQMSHCIAPLVVFINTVVNCGLVRVEIFHSKSQNQH